MIVDAPSAHLGGGADGMAHVVRTGRIARRSHSTYLRHHGVDPGPATGDEGYLSCQAHGLSFPVSHASWC
jgi:hypothetical protein